MSTPRFTHDSEADAIYVYLAEEHLQQGRVARTVSLDDQRNVDYSTDGSVIGVEFLDVSDGVNLRGVPSAEIIARLLNGEVAILAA